MQCMRYILPIFIILVGCVRDMPIEEAHVYEYRIEAEVKPPERRAMSIVFERCGVNPTGQMCMINENQIQYMVGFDSVGLDFLPLGIRTIIDKNDPEFRHIMLDTRFQF